MAGGLCVGHSRDDVAVRYMLERALPVVGRLVGVELKAIVDITH